MIFADGSRVRCLRARARRRRLGRSIGEHEALGAARMAGPARGRRLRARWRAAAARDSARRRRLRRARRLLDEAGGGASRVAAGEGGGERGRGGGAGGVKRPRRRRRRISAARTRAGLGVAGRPTMEPGRRRTRRCNSATPKIRGRWNSWQPRKGDANHSPQPHVRPPRRRPWGRGGGGGEPGRTGRRPRRRAVRAPPTSGASFRLYELQLTSRARRHRSRPASPACGPRSPDEASALLADRRDAPRVRRGARREGRRGRRRRWRRWRTPGRGGRRDELHPARARQPARPNAAAADKAFDLMYRLRIKYSKVRRAAEEPARALMASFEATKKSSSREAMVRRRRATSRTSSAPRPPPAARGGRRAAVGAADPHPRRRPAAPLRHRHLHRGDDDDDRDDDDDDRRASCAAASTPPPPHVEGRREPRRSPTGRKPPGRARATRPRPPRPPVRCATLQPPPPPPSPPRASPGPAPPPGRHAADRPPAPSRAGACRRRPLSSTHPPSSASSQHDEIQGPAPAAPAAPRRRRRHRPTSGSRAASSPHAAGGGRAARAAAAGGGRLPHSFRLPDGEEAMAPGDGSRARPRSAGRRVSLNANRMKFVGDLFDGRRRRHPSSATRTWSGETTAAPTSWDAIACRRPRAFPSPGPSPVRSSPSGSAAATADLPTAWRRAPHPRPRLVARDAPPRRADRAADGAPRPCAPVLRPERTVANEQVIRVSGEVCMRLRATWGENFAVTKRRILCYHTQMRCCAAPDWGSARLGTKTTWRGARLVRILAAAPPERPGTSTRVDGLDEAVRALDVRCRSTTDGPPDLRPMIGVIEPVLRASGGRRARRRGTSGCPRSSPA